MANNLDLGKVADLISRISKESPVDQGSQPELVKAIWS